MNADQSLQCCPAAATVNSGLGTEPGREAGQRQARTPNHAHRAEVSLVAPSGRMSGLKGNRMDRPSIID